MSMGVWRTKGSFGLTILNGRSYSEQGGYPVVHAQRNNKKTFLLDETLDDSETGVDVTSGGVPGLEIADVLAGTVILIDTEQMVVESISGKTLTVARGYASTTPAAHTSGATITVVTTGDGAIDMAGISWMSIIKPAVWTAADIAWFCCETRGGVYVPMRDEVGVILQNTVLSATVKASHYVPGKVNAGGPFVKMRSITVGTDPTSAVAQGGDRVFTVVYGE